MPATALTELQTRAVNHAVRSFRAWKVPPTLAREDVWQEACLGVIAAGKTLDSARPLHEQEAWLARRALGAIQDACARARRRHVELDAMAPERRPADALDLDTPDALATVGRALEAVAAMPAPLHTVVRLALAGSSGRHIAQTLGVSESRVSQLRGELARRLARHLPVHAPAPTERHP